MAAKTDLVIVESPSKAKTIGKYLGPGYEVKASMGHVRPGYEVKASMGHVRDLPKSKLGVDVEHGFEPNYQPIKGKEDTISDLKKAAKKSGKVYLATDPDREGEAISWHLKELLDIPDDKTYRVTFNEITKKVVNESIAKPRAIGSWAMSSPPCCGRRSAGACPPDGCSRWPPAWWWSGRRRSAPSSPRSTGPSRPT